MGRIIGQPPLAGTKPASLYPWDEWTDGSWWEIERGVNFAVSIPAMRSMLYGRFGSAGPLKPEIRLDAPARTATRIWFRYVPRVAHPMRQNADKGGHGCLQCPYHDIENHRGSP